MKKSTMKNQADEMAAKFRHDCRMAALKRAAVMLGFVAVVSIVTWLVMLWR